MATQILATKLYIPPSRSTIVLRPHLIERLNEGTCHQLTLISAPAGFGKTTLVSEWVASCERPVAWLSLDQGDSDLTRFLTYLVSALQTLALSNIEGIAENIGEGMLNVLQDPQPPSIESILTTLLNEITTIPNNFILVLDDYHLIDSKPVDKVLTFLVEHMPPQMHLIIATREDPNLPLARLRARDQLTELRAADLRFTPSEAAEFLNQVMGLNLTPADIAALETRTEGWIAGLQLAAISMQGHEDTTSFIKSFAGSHRFVLDYLVEEVLGRQSESILDFLLRTSILDRMCGPLCDAVLIDPSGSGQETLEYIESANLFVVPLDDERKWFRYHHLFAQLLRQRLNQSDNVGELHRRASQWYEDHGLEIEAFHHAAAANDIERAERLVKGSEMPMHSLPAVTAIINWLDSLPKTVLDARPWLWVRSATATLMSGKITGVEEKLQAAERSLQNADLDDKTRDLIGQIAAIRATLAVLQYDPEDAIIQARRALDNLYANNLLFRSRAFWALGFAYQLQGNRAEARQAYGEAIKQASGNTYYTVLSSTSLGKLQESDNQLCQAAETYRRSVQLFSDQGPPNASEEFIGLARICYEWNDLDTAKQYGQQSLQLARQYDPAIDRYVGCEVFLARLKLAQGKVAEAAAILAEADRSVRQNNFVQRIPEVVAAQVLTLLRQGDVTSATRLVQTHDLPISQARVFLAQGEPSEALAILEPCRQQMEAKDWKDEQLKVMVLEAVALSIHKEKDKAVNLLGEALALAEPGGFIRTFIDEGAPMKQLLSEAVARGLMPDYANKLLDVFIQPSDTKSSLSPDQPLVEPLSERELDVLKLLRSELSGPEIAQQLIVSLNTLRTHTKSIFNKLGVNNRRSAVRRAEELDLF